MRREATPPPRRTPTTVSPSSRYALLCGFRCDESFHLHPSSEGRRRSGNLRFSRLHLLSCAALDRRPASRMRRRKSCAVDDALRKKGRAANCRGVVEADGFAWGKTPIDVGGKHPSLSRSPPPAPAIDSQRRLTPPAEKRAKGGAWVAARLRIPTAEVFMCTRRSATAVVIATPLCLGPPTARAANLQMVSTVRPAIRSRPLPLRRRQPVTSAAVPAGGGCGRRACWSEAPTGFTHNNGDGSTTGTVALTLKRRAHRRS